MYKKIVVAEDDPGIQDVLRLILEGAGYETVIFSSGAQLLAAGFCVPDLYLIDKRLPGIDGLEVCAELKKATAHIPVIIISATPHIQNLAKYSGADAFIEKPFSKKHLLETIGALIPVWK